MRRTIATLMGALLVTLMGAGTLAVPAVSFAQAPGQLQRQRRNNFPVMRAALERLQKTKEMLTQDAAQDFHGHRVNAINHIDAAIQELRLGIQSDRAH
jgi:hypothetical protein